MTSNTYWFVFQTVVYRGTPKFTPVSKYIEALFSIMTLFSNRLQDRRSYLQMDKSITDRLCRKGSPKYHQNISGNLKTICFINPCHCLFYACETAWTLTWPGARVHSEHAYHDQHASLVVVAVGWVYIKVHSSPHGTGNSLVARHGALWSDRDESEDFIDITSNWFLKLSLNPLSLSWKA